MAYQYQFRDYFNPSKLDIRDCFGMQSALRACSFHFCKTRTAFRPNMQYSQPSRVINCQRNVMTRKRINCEYFPYWARGRGGIVTLKPTAWVKGGCTENICTSSAFFPGYPLNSITIHLFNYSTSHLFCIVLKLASMNTHKLCIRRANL